MTEDPYRLDDDLHLSSIDNDFDDEYDGLDTQHGHEPKRGLKKMPLVLAMMMTVFVAGAGYIAYQMFVVDVGPLAPAQPPLSMAQQQPPFMGDEMMPPMADAAPMHDMSGQAAPPMENADMPPVTDESGIAAEAMLPPPVMDGMETADTDMPPADGFVEEASVEFVDAAIVDPAAEQAVVAEAAPSDVVPMETMPVDAAPVVTAEIATDVVADMPAEMPEPVTAVAEAPPEALLQPIDPVPAVTAPAAKKAAPATIQENVEAMVATAKTTSSAASKQADEVQKILESAGISKNAASAAPVAPPPPVEVTPRAREVIVVTRSHGAQSPQAVIAAGDRVLQANQYGAAAEIYDNQLRQNPSDPLALAGKALALQKAGDHIEAMNTYERLLNLNPRDIEALTNYLGLLQQQDPQQALVRLQALSAQYPQNAAVSGQLGMLYARIMDTPNAIRQFQTAAALDSTNATYPFNLAVLYDRLGSKDKARHEYRRALGLVRDYPSRADVSIEVIRQRLHALSR